MTATSINLSEKINPVYQPYFWSEERFLVLYGGAGSGKSHFATEKIITRCLQESGHRFLVCRKVARTLRESVFELFQQILIDWGLFSRCKINKTDMTIILPSADGNTSKIIFMGMDDREKVKSIANITGVWCEEATEFDEGDIDQLNIRMRGKSPSYKQMLITFNPISETHWLKRKYFDVVKEGVETLKTTYKDNGHLDAEYIEALEALIHEDENLARIYVKGEWGVIKTGEEFFDKFKRLTHVRRLSPSQDYTPIFAIDYNNRPYMTCVELEKRSATKEYAIIREFCMKPPVTVESLIEWVVAETGCTECYWIDDPSGKAEGSKKSRGELKSLSAAVEKSFKDQGVWAKKIKLTKAPPLRTRKRAWGKILSQHEGWSLVIDENCKNTIFDFESLQEDTSGAWVKKKVRDKEKAVTYEEGGHIADALTYYFCTEFPDLFKKKGSFGY